MVKKSAAWDSNGWTAAPNQIIRDQTLSMEARWLWVYIASHTETFIIKMELLQEAAGCGRDKLRNIIKELTEAGLLNRTQEGGSGGNRFGYMVYELSFTRSAPSTGFPSPELPSTELPATEDTTPYKNTNSKNTSCKKTTTNTPPTETLFKITAITASPPGFAEFYACYPKKVDKAAAGRKWDTLIKKGEEPTALIEAAKRYAAATEGTEKRYIKSPVVWLNKGCWDDEDLPQRPQPEYVPYRNPSDQSVYDDHSWSSAGNWESFV